MIKAPLISFYKFVTVYFFVAIVPLFLLVGVIFAQESDQNSQDTVAEITESSVAENPNSLITVEKLQSTPEPLGDYVVGPGRIELSLRPGETVTDYIVVSNRISDDRIFNLTVEDIAGTVDGSQNVVLLGDVDGPYTLRNYVSFASDSFPLNLNERARVPVTISVPTNAEPGGYYGTILVNTIQVSEQTETQSARSPIRTRLGVLLFITVQGEAEVSGEVVGFSTKNNKSFFSKGPIPFALTFQNSGNIHLNPYGELRISNILGEEVGYVTLDPWFVLPNALRVRDITWDRERLLGRYTVTASINRGYQDIIDTQSFTIWVVPWQLLLIIFVTILILNLIWYWLRKNFEFKRKA